MNQQQKVSVTKALSELGSLIKGEDIDKDIKKIFKISKIILEKTGESFRPTFFVFSKSEGITAYSGTFPSNEKKEEFFNKLGQKIFKRTNDALYFVFVAESFMYIDDKKHKEEKKTLEEIEKRFQEIKKEKKPLNVLTLSAKKKNGDTKNLLEIYNKEESFFEWLADNDSVKRINQVGWVKNEVYRSKKMLQKSVVLESLYHGYCFNEFLKEL